jgi:uncharacterized membrane protein YqaE (UPF0057 family)
VQATLIPKRSHYPEFDMDLVRIILAIILPPLGVFLQVGLGKHFWINILLTLLGYIPGIVHAVWIIARTGPRSV